MGSNNHDEKKRFYPIGLVILILVGLGLYAMSKTELGMEILATASFIFLVGLFIASIFKK